ncbi:helix-turn-helix domain-containing protein [Streptomyces anulatus]|uniref:helix-turn-helix domain-containing protein n=1 Tax=Streptomyces anulatus TaxID=1892 RepID=UPI001C255078|nr:helix-turn-helix transcriptional regulator [Streptomyces anulatus]
MTSEWNKHQRISALRGADVVTAVLSDTAGRDAAGRLVVERVLGGLLELLVDGDLAEETDRAADAVRSLTRADTADEEATRAWLARTLRERADEHNRDVDPRQRGWVDLSEHDVWTLLALHPLARRVRLWSATLKQSATALGAAVGVGAHQVRHWSSGNSLPSKDHRAALALALGVHPAWLATERDRTADTDLYLYDGACPCGAGAEFTSGPVGAPGYPERESRGAVRWCNGCGQPLLPAGRSRLIPLPVMRETDTPGDWPDFRAVYVRTDRDLSEPWPHGLWCPSTTTRERGPVRVPSMLVQPPRQAPAPAAVRPQLPAPRRRPEALGPTPKAGEARSGTQKIQALVRWVGGGRRLTGKGHLKLAHARTLVEVLDTGDVWDPVEYGHQYRTHSSADLYHLQRLLTWTTTAGLLHRDGDLLLPVHDSLRLAESLPTLQAALADALVDVSLAVLGWPPVLSPLSDEDDLRHALAVLWLSLASADAPLPAASAADEVWAAIGIDEDGDEVFADPAGAEQVVRRDVASLLRLCADIGLVHQDNGLLTLSPFGQARIRAGAMP